MELSLQKNKNYREMLRRRKMMITKEKLHINTRIDYEEFLQLFRKYGKGVEEKDFAQYILDIPYLKHYYLKSGKFKSTPILSREYVSTKYLETIKEQVEEFIKKEEIKKIGYSLFTDLYDTYGGKLDMPTFGEEILGISAHSIECMKSGSQKKAVLFSSSSINSAEVRKKQNEIILAEKLHINDNITLSRFKELYEKYGSEFSEKDFANKILQISQQRFNRLKAGKSDYTSVLSNYIMNPEFIFKLREKVIQKEKLHLEDLIDYSIFQRLYKKYGIPLTEEMFAEEILDINAIGLLNMKTRGNNAIILNDVEIPEEFILELKNKIVTENSLWPKQLITSEFLEELYKKYGGVLSKRQFVTLALGVEAQTYNASVSKGYGRIKILNDNNDNELKELRKRVIAENNLHYDDLIDYEMLKKLQQTYAPTQSETVFAESVLDLPQRTFYNLKYGSTKKVNILLDEPLPSDEEFEKLKLSIALKYGLHIQDKMNYQTFKKIYNRHAGIVPEYMFAERILDITKPTFSRMQKDSEAQVFILSNTEIPEDTKERLRKQMILENNLYPGKEISLVQFNEMYKREKHILSEKLFAKEILGINIQSFNKLKNESSEFVEIFSEERKEIKQKRKFLRDDEVKRIREYLIQGLTEEEIASRLFVTMHFLKKNMEGLFRYERISLEEIEEEKRRRSQTAERQSKQSPKSKDTETEEKKSKEKRRIEGYDLRKKKQKIINDFDFSDRDIITLKSYVRNCVERFQNGEFPETELIDVEECFEYFEADIKLIKLFAKMCISFGSYEKANIFISKNMDNSNITNQEKGVLEKMHANISYAIRKVEAVDMITKGHKDTNYIANRTGMREIDVVLMQKRMAQGENPIENVFPTAPDFEEKE